MVDVSAIQTGLNVATGLLQVALAAFLVFHSPSSTARRLLALVLVLTTALRFPSFGALVGPSVTGGPGWEDVFLDIADANAFALLAFFAFYPTRVSWRSPHAIAIAVAATLLVLAVLIRFFWSELSPAGSPPTLIGMSVGVNSFGFGRSFTREILIASALFRAASLPVAERKGAVIVILAAGIETFTRFGVTAVGLLALFLGVPHFFVPFESLWGLETDPLHLSVGFTALSRLVIPAFLATWVLRRMGMRHAWALAIFGGAVSILGDFGELAYIEEPETLFAFLVAFAVFRHGAFGVREVPPWIRIALTVGGAATAFLLVDGAVLSVAGDSLIGPSVGILLGLLAAIGAGWFFLPLSIPKVITLATPVTDGASSALPLGRLAPGSLALARYRVSRVLGEGGQGVTYLARDEKLDRDVVLKTVARGDAAALREARAAARVDHENVVRVLDVAETSAETVLVLEFVDGGSLRSRLARGPLPPREARSIACDVLSGLAEAHAAGVVHRDVKPENVLLTRAGRAKVTDFGIARTAGAQATAQAQPAGTLPYMSPEHVRGKPPDARSDLYSLGVLLHEALTLRVPFPHEGEDDFSLRARIVAGRLEFAPGLGDFEPVVRRALATDANDRYSSALTMREAVLADRA